MMKYYVILGLLTVVSARYRFPRGIIHEHAQAEQLHEHSPIGESHHHHQVEHEHAKSHQSVKFEHFHPVPVYVKKEHSHLLKEPLTKGNHELKLKQVHPETEHVHGYGLVLEDLRHNSDHHADGFGDFQQFAAQSDNAEHTVHVPEQGHQEELQGWAPYEQQYEAQHYE